MLLPRFTLRAVLAEKPTAAERRIKIRRHAGSWDWRSGTISVEQHFDLPVGAASAETVVACPQYFSGQRYWWHVWGDGAADRELGVAESAAGQLVATGSENSTNTALEFLMGASAPLCPHVWRQTKRS